MRYGSVCSGIEAVTMAWHPLGLEPAWFSEIEPFPCAVLAHHYPTTPNLGDMTTIAARVLAGEVEAPDILVGGTPCQSFSVAGLRRGLEDARGNLALAFVELADAIDSVRRDAGRPPAWVLWENVPGALTVDDGGAFGSILGGLVGSDDAIPGRAGWPRAGVVSGPSRRAAWRFLDARYHGVAQRRDRLFVLARGGAGDWSAAEALLPLVPRSRWNPAPGRAAGPRAPGVAAGRAPGGSGPAPRGDLPDVSYCLSGGPGGNQFGTGRDGQDTFIPESTHLELAGEVSREVASALTSNYGKQPDNSDTGLGPNLVHGVPVAYSVVPEGGQGADLRVSQVDVAPALASKNEGVPGYDRGVRVATDMAVRRLTPVECARLQGFPDTFLDIPGATDSAKYRALGNSMAVPVMAYLGRRLLAVGGPRA